MDDKLEEFMRLISDFDANTAKRSSRYRSSWRLRGGSSVMSCWYVRIAESKSKLLIAGTCALLAAVA